MAEETTKLMFDALKEMREESREFRRRFETKIDEQSAEVKEIKVSLAEGAGRMDLIQQTLDTVKDMNESQDQRLKAIEKASGLRPAVISEAKPEGGWIAADKLPLIIAAIGSLVAVVLSAVAVTKTQTKETAPTTVSPP